MSESEPQPAASSPVLRALTADHFIRIAVLDASPLWDGIRRSHPHLEPDACACLTELMAATALLQSRTLFAERVQLLLKGSGRARAVVADSWPDGMIRGVLDLAEKAEGPWVEAPGILQVMRSSTSGQPYIGNLPLVEGSVTTQLEAYLLHSEQIQASVTLWCDPATGEAGGLMVEPLPACPPERLARLVQAIDGLEVVPFWERKPDFLINWISQGEGAEIFAASQLNYGCRCNRETLLATLAAFPADQKTHIFDAGDPVEVRCDYCGQTYAIHRADLPEGPA
jgi:molecular chaperone Hsp33